DFVDRLQPRLDSTPATLEQVLVHPVVGDIAGHDQTDRGYVQHGGVVGIGMSGLDRLHAMALELKPVARDRLVDHRAVGDKTGKIYVPQLFTAFAALRVHQPDRALSGVGDRARDALHQQVGAEPVIAVAVGGVDV